MEIIRYYLDAVEQALNDTVEFFKLDKKSFVTLCMFLLGLGLWKYYRGFVAAMDKVSEFLLFILIPGGFAFVGLFIWNLFLAPVRLRATERAAYGQQIEELKREHTNLNNELHAIKDSLKAPNLTFRPWLTKGGLINPQGQRVGMAVTAELIITNTSQIGTNIIPEIRYEDTASGRVLRVHGRWVDGAFSDTKGAAVMPITLFPGQPRRLGIAVQFNGEKVQYALDNDSPFDGYRVKRNELTGPTSIMVTLKGDKNPVTEYFTLKDENGIPKLDGGIRNP